MIELELDIHPEVLNQVWAEFQRLVEGFSWQQLPVQRSGSGNSRESSEAELEEVLEAELRERLRQDCAWLLAVFKELHDGARRLQVDETTAEGILRASSAVRLALRRTALKGISDEALEGAPFLAHMIQKSQQGAFLTYCFLAALQSMILEAMDPEL